MFQEKYLDLQLWNFDSLSLRQEIKHFVSGREGGVSKGEKGSLNLSFSANVGDEHENVAENRRRVAAALGIVSEKLIFPAQTHSANVKVASAVTSQKDLEDTDALITNTPGICISVMSADCVPILLYDPEKKAVAAVHAGWKGTVLKILIHTIERMKSEFGTDPGNLLAGIGPSICPEVYEVGEEVIEAVKNAFGQQTAGLLSKENKRTKKAYLNLWEANRRQLIESGMLFKNIEVAGLCTYLGSDQFFSARKSKNAAGRFAAGIMINNT